MTMSPVGSVTFVGAQNWIYDLARGRTVIVACSRRPSSHAYSMSEIADRTLSGGHHLLLDLDTWLCGQRFLHLYRDLSAWLADMSEIAFALRSRYQ